MCFVSIVLNLAFEPSWVLKRQLLKLKYLHLSVVPFAYFYLIKFQHLKVLTNEKRGGLIIVAFDRSLSISYSR
jgi:hypothetical protein